MVTTESHISEETAVVEEVGCVDAAPEMAHEQGEAWLGFLAAHSQLTRALDQGLTREFALSRSALEVLARIVHEPAGRERISNLADSALLSQSRVSRIVDQLEQRGLVERHACGDDSRGVWACITPPGRELTSRALEWHLAEVESRFFGVLTERQVKQLAAIWNRVLGGSVAERLGRA